MIRRSGTILTLVLVTAVLCADRAVMAAAEVQPQAVEAARQVVRRLTAALQSKSTIPPQRYRLSGNATAMPAVPTKAADTAMPPGVICSPAQLPIPPPIA